MTTIAARMRAKLEAALAPTRLEVRDDLGRIRALGRITLPLGLEKPLGQGTRRLGPFDHRPPPLQDREPVRFISDRKASIAARVRRPSGVRL